MTALCPTCNQPLPAPQRTDPPLPPLESPAVVTIHDLSAEEKARAEVEIVPHCLARRLVERHD